VDFLGTHMISLVLFFRKPGVTSGACLFRKSSGDGRGTLEDPHRPPRRLRSPPALAPRATLPTPQELLPELLPAILYDANV
jgi:hypothetical protein